MQRTGRGGLDGVKNRSGKCEGPGRRGGTNGCLKRKVFLKNQKHQPNIVQITHLCIMHGVHTSMGFKQGAIGNTLGALRTYWELDWNPLGTLKEHIGNKGKMKKNPLPPPPKT